MSKSQGVLDSGLYFDCSMAYFIFAALTKEDKILGSILDSSLIKAEFIPIQKSELSTLSVLCQKAIGFYEKMGGVVVGRDEGNEESWQDSVMFEFLV